MAGNQLSLAYLQVGFSKDEQKELDQALKRRISTLRPNLDSLETRRRVRRTPSEIQERETHVSESISAYRPTSRGQQPYCCSRTPDPRSRLYHDPTPDRPCDCGRSHKVPNPKEWQSSLAEVAKWDYNLPNGGYPIRKSMVSFADPIVTEVREFERWYVDCYGCFSKRGMTGATVDDDEREIRMLDAQIRGLELVKVSSERKGLESWCGEAVSLDLVTKEGSAEVRDEDEGLEWDATMPAGVVREGRPRIKSLRKVSHRSVVEKNTS